MTEQEQKAIKWMQNVRDDAVVTLDHIAKEEPNVSPMFYAGRKEKAETIINGFEELEQYRAMEKRLEAIYGDCPGLLETVVEHLERHDGIGTDKPAFKARLLTDDNVDKWDSYKEIGTPEECRAAVEKQTTMYWDAKHDECICPRCATHNPTWNMRAKTVEHDKVYCWHCGQSVEF